MKVINFFGGPSAGKSTTAAGLYVELKKRWVPAEQVLEFAKDLVWDDTSHLLSQQNFVFANQERRLNRLEGKVQVAVSDSPLPLSAFYAPRNYPLSFKQCVFDFFSRYDNINFFVRRSHAYATEGRLQNQEEADAVAQAMELFLLDNGVPYYAITANDANPIYLLYWLVHANLVELPPNSKPFEPEDQPPPGWIQPSFQQRLDDKGLPIPMANAVGQFHIPEWVRTKGDSPSEGVLTPPGQGA